MRTVALLLATLAIQASAQTPPRKQIVEDLRLDSSAEDFPVISGFSVGPRGQMAVYVRPDQSFRLYDASGRKTANFGRRGSGPGESRAVNQLGWKGDTLYTYDVSLKRLTYATLDGKLVRHEVLSPSLNTDTKDITGDPNGLTVLFVPLRLPPDGRLLAWGSIGTGRDDQGNVKTETRLLVTNVDGSARKAVGMPVEWKNLKTQVDVRDDEGRRFTAGVPFQTTPSMICSADGTRFGYVTHSLEKTGGTYTVVVVKSTGDTLFNRTYRFVGEPIPAAVRDSAIHRLRFAKSGNVLLYPTPIASKLEAMIAPITPYVYRPVTDLTIGRDNTVWLTKRASKNGVEAVALNERGDPLFSVMLPPRSTVREGSREQLWVEQLDEDDLPSIVRYRIK